FFFFAGYVMIYRGLSPEFSRDIQSDDALRIVSLIWSICWWLYFALMESSTRQATIGKRAMKLIVTDLSGGRISFVQATGRFLGRFIAWFPGGFGYLTLIFSRRHQGLHDMMAGTVVVPNHRASDAIASSSEPAAVL